MGIDKRQSPQERAELAAKWHAHPKVVRFKAEMLEFVRGAGLDFNVDGMNASAFFAQQWLKDNGDLPDSGIFTG